MRGAGPLVRGIILFAWLLVFSLCIGRAPEEAPSQETVVEELNEPVLGIFGDADRAIPLDEVRSFEDALKGLGTSTEIHVYEGAPHAFANPTNTQAFRRDQAVDAWMKTLDFLERQLGG